MAPKMFWNPNGGIVYKIQDRNLLGKSWGWSLQLPDPFEIEEISCHEYSPGGNIDLFSGQTQGQNS